MGEEEQQLGARPHGERTILALQFFVGALVTFGGLEFAMNGSYPLGTIVGSGHVFVGLFALYAGFAFLKWRDRARLILFLADGLTIAYSVSSESAAELAALLPEGVTDSLIGTVAAVIAAGLVVCLLWRNKPKREA